MEGVQRRENPSFKELVQYLASITPESWTNISQEFQGSDATPQYAELWQTLGGNIQQSGQRQQIQQFFEQCVNPAAHQPTTKQAGAKANL